MSDELDEPIFRSWGEYWSIARRRRWWILLPLFLAWSAAWSISWILPATYWSESMILVEQQKVPDQYVVPNVTSNLQGRLESLTQQILSRTRLQATIDRFHLYPQATGWRRFAHPNDPVEQMRSDIKIELVDTPGRPGEFTAFKMRYSAGSPELARAVNEELTTLFIHENLKVQQELSENTTAFLETQLADARANMGAQEAKVAAFKAKHLGELPNQLESNVQILSGLQNQLQSAQQTLDAAKQQRLYLESLLQQYQTAQASLGTGSVNGSAPALEKELLDMRVRLHDLQSRYTSEHPDIVALQDKIRKTEKLKQLAQTEVPADQKSPGTMAPVDAMELGAAGGAPTSMMQVQSQLQANQMEIRNDQQREKELASQISAYQVRLNLTPQTEQELINISRGYEESKANYDSLQQKQMQSQLATSLEHQQQGQQFRVVDPPSFPIKSASPNRLLFSLSGLVGGLCLGLGLAAALEKVDVRIRQESDLAGIVPARVLVGIPRLNTAVETRSLALRQRAEAALAVTLMMLMALGNIYSLYKG